MSDETGNYRRTCEMCKKDFLAKPWQAAIGTGRFCGNKCRLAYQRQKGMGRIHPLGDRP